MLFQLIVFRFLPLTFFAFFKERGQIQKIAIVVLGIYLTGFCFAVWNLVAKYQWLGIVSVPLSMFPHYLCYGFAGWILARCLWFSWSKRVWKRIFFVSLLSVFLGVLLENYWNPKILQIFFEIFK